MAFGSGGCNAHAPDELVDVETLVCFVKIYGLIMLDIRGMMNDPSIIASMFQEI